MSETRCEGCDYIKPYCSCKSDAGAEGLEVKEYQKPTVCTNCGMTEMTEETFGHYNKTLDEIDKLRADLEQQQGIIKGYSDLINLLKSERMSLKADLATCVVALEKINEEELRSQRPGGGHSRSAMISYETLKKIRGK